MPDGEGGAPGGPGGDNNDGGGQAPRTYDEAYVANVRNEAAGWRTKFRQADTELTTYKTNDQDRATKLTTYEGENTALKAQVADLLVGNAAMDSASTLGAIYPKAVVKLIDKSKIKFNEKQEPINLAELLAEVKTEYPAMFRTTQNDMNGGSGSQPNGMSGGFTTLIRDRATQRRG